MLVWNCVAPSPVLDKTRHNYCVGHKSELGGGGIWLRIAFYSVVRGGFGGYGKSFLLTLLLLLRQLIYILCIYPITATSTSLTQRILSQRPPIIFQLDANVLELPPPLSMVPLTLHDFGAVPSGILKQPSINNYGAAYAFRYHYDTSKHQTSTTYHIHDRCTVYTKLFRLLLSRISFVWK